MCKTFYNYFEQHLIYINKRGKNDVVNYGNTGYGVSSLGIQNLKTFCLEIALIEIAHHRTYNEFIRWFHQSQIPNLWIFWRNICYDFLFNCPNWEKCVETINETNWWKNLMSDHIQWLWAEDSKKNAITAAHVLTAQLSWCSIQGSLS